MKNDRKTLETFLGIINASSEKALLALVEALAEEAGHPVVRGLPVRQFYLQERARCIEEEVAHYADEDIGAASYVKQLLEKWKQDHGKV